MDKRERATAGDKKKKKRKKEKRKEKKENNKGDQFCRKNNMKIL